jgi:hypothetical protein
VVVICTCQTLSDEIHTLRRWDDSRKKYPLLILRNLHISEHVVLHHFALPRFNNDSDKRPHLMSTTCHISRTCGISNRSRSLFLSPRIYTCKTPPLIHPAPLILSLALSNTTDPQASQPSPPSTQDSWDVTQPVHLPPTLPPSQHCIGTSGLRVLLWRALDPTSVA